MRMGERWTVSVVRGASPEGESSRSSSWQSRGVAGRPGSTSRGPWSTSTACHSLASQILLGARSVTTSASGEFTFPGVAPPYDLIAVQGPPTNGALVYQGLTRTDPFLRFTTGTVTSHSGTITGALDGGSFVDTLTLATLDSPNLELSGNDASAITSSPFSFATNWTGGKSTTGILRILQRTTSEPVTYAYGSRSNVTVVEGGTANQQDVALTPVETSSFSVTVPSPLTDEVDAYVVFDHSRVYLGVVLFPKDTASFVIPRIPGTTITIAAAHNPPMMAGTFTTLSGLAPDASGVAINFTSPPGITSPGGGATNVDTSTEFTFTPFEGGMHHVTFEGTPSQPRFDLFTAGTTVRIPDLAAFGLGLPSQSTYTIHVSGMAPPASVDAYASEGSPVDPPELRSGYARFLSFVTR